MQFKDGSRGKKFERVLKEKDANRKSVELLLGICGE